MTASEWHYKYRYWPRFMRIIYARYKLAYETNLLGIAYWQHVCKSIARPKSR